MTLPGRVLRSIRRHAMFAGGARVLVGLSGGPDSVALLHILRTLERDGELKVAAVAHVNHQLRGADADEDERFCRELAAATGVPIEVVVVDVASLAREIGRSIEDTARSVRYKAFHEAAARHGADAIAVGHSLEDQAETFLLRLLRGAGSRGLGGIRPRAGKVVRPFIDIARADLREYAAAEGLTFREDRSNADVTVPRNRIRHELIPYLQQYSPAIVDVLAREASLARADEDYLQGRAIELASSIVLIGERGAEVDAEALKVLPQPLASRVARLALEASAAGRFIGSHHIERFLELAGAPVGASASLPGLTIVRRTGRIVFRTEPEEAAFSNSFRFPLSIPGEVVLEGWTVTAASVEDPAGVTMGSARGRSVVVAANAACFPLAVRTRRRGDRFKPLGMGGRGRKLQDLLVDRKIARHERDSLPLVVDRDDRIVWVVGQAVSEDFRVTDPRQGVILLKARRLGGVG